MPINFMGMGPLSLTATPSRASTTGYTSFATRPRRPPSPLPSWQSLLGFGPAVQGIAGLASGALNTLGALPGVNTLLSRPAAPAPPTGGQGFLATLRNLWGRAAPAAQMAGGAALQALGPALGPAASVGGALLGGQGAQGWGGQGWGGRGIEVAPATPPAAAPAPQAATAAPAGPSPDEQAARQRLLDWLAKAGAEAEAARGEARGFRQMAFSDLGRLVNEPAVSPEARRAMIADMLRTAGRREQMVNEQTREDLMRAGLASGGRGVELARRTRAQLGPGVAQAVGQGTLQSLLANAQARRQGLMARAGYAGGFPVVQRDYTPEIRTAAESLETLRKRAQQQVELNLIRATMGGIV
jgi:hypothetical protein